MYRGVQVFAVEGNLSLGIIHTNTQSRLTISTSPKSLEMKFVKKLWASVMCDMFSDYTKRIRALICTTFTISNAWSFKSEFVQKLNSSMVVGFSQ